MKPFEDSGPAVPEDLGEAGDGFSAILGQDESVGVSRKKVLLRLLAVRECERLGIALSPGEREEATGACRRRFGLVEEGDLDGWLASAGLDRGDFARLVAEVTLVDRLEARLDGPIQEGLPLQRAARSAHWWRGERWVQFNLGLHRDGPGGAVASAVRVFDRLWPLVVPGTRLPGLRRFFLMRKAPGIRLRLAGGDLESLRETFGEALADLEREGVVPFWFVVPYEAERVRFGGMRGLDLAHDWFDADSLNWMRFEPLASRRGNRLGRDVLSLGVLNHLFLAVLRDEAEVWDVWCRLAAQHGIPLDTAADRTPPVTVDSLMELAEPAEREILAAYEQANLEAAVAFDRAAREGGLTAGPREILATMALFHWNRFGLSAEERIRIVAPMLRALDPHRTSP